MGTVIPSHTSESCLTDSNADLVIAITDINSAVAPNTVTPSGGNGVFNANPGGS